MADEESTADVASEAPPEVPAEAPLEGEKAPVVEATPETEPDAPPDAGEPAPETAPEAPDTAPEAPEAAPEAPDAPAETPGAASEAPAAESEPPEAASEAPGAASEAPAAESEAPAAESEAPAAESEAPAAESEAPAAESEPPDAAAEVPVAASEAPEAETEATEAESEAPADAPEGGDVPPTSEMREPSIETELEARPVDEDADNLFGGEEEAEPSPEGETGSAVEKPEGEAEAGGEAVEGEGEAGTGEKAEAEGEEVAGEPKEAAEGEEKPLPEGVVKDEFVQEKETGIEEIQREAEKPPEVVFADDVKPELRGLGVIDDDEPIPLEGTTQVTFGEKAANALAAREQRARADKAVRMRKLAESIGMPGDLLEEFLIAEAEREIQKTELNLGVAIFQREPYLDRYDMLSKEYLDVKLKNNYLQRKMVEYFKKRKMEHVLKETDLSPDTYQKYDRKLDKLSELYTLFDLETTRIGEELKELKEEKEMRENAQNAHFSKMLATEKETGTGLISTKTGKPISDKMVDYLIRRQSASAKQITKIRLKYITIRDLMAEKQAELKALDNIGDDLSLMDYEQLKIDNRAYADKLEEREEELCKLRLKCRNAIQIMAHIREKSAALDSDMLVLKEQYDEVKAHYVENREKLNNFKTERDMYRSLTTKLQMESGLLTKPKLLLDMEESLEEYKIVKQTLDELKDEYQHKTKQIRALRRNIAIEMAAVHKAKKVKKQPAGILKIHRELKFNTGYPENSKN